MTRPRLLRSAGIVAAVTAALLTSWPAPAAADLSQPPGACEVTTTWGEGGPTVESASAEPGAVIEVPRAEKVTWSARVNGPEEGVDRPVAGSVSLALPAPLGTVTLDEWTGATDNIETSGVRSLPDLLPAGVIFDLRLEHHENGSLFCTATVRLRMEGGPGPIAWTGLALMLLFGALLSMVGIRGGCSFWMRLLAAGLGLLIAILLGGTLVLFGVLPLNSIVTVVLALVGLVFGSVLCKLRRLLRRNKKDEEKKPTQSPQPVEGSA
jgi:hypothetical protein